MAQHRHTRALGLAVEAKGRVCMHRRLGGETQVRTAQGEVAQGRACQVSVTERLLHLQGLVKQRPRAQRVMGGI